MPTPPVPPRPGSTPSAEGGGFGYRPAINGGAFGLDRQVTERASVEEVARIFERMGYTVVRDALTGGLRVDLIVEREGQRTAVEVTLLRQANPVEALRQQVLRLVTLTSLGTWTERPLLVVVGELSAATAQWARHQEDVQIVTLDILRDQAGPTGEEVDEPTVVDPIFTEARREDDRDRLRADLIRQLEDHAAERTTLTPKGFETLCMEVFIFLFDPVLFGFKSQAETSDGANRYDFICRIAADSGFWGGIQRDFRTRAVLFECKNYKDPITADQIYSTERYLFAGALRTVCFLIAKKGATDAGLRAAQGAMRESGKLILVLSNQDLIDLLRIGLTREAAEDMLDEKIWDFIISLPR